MYELEYLYEQLKIKTTESQYINVLDSVSESCYDTIEADNAVQNIILSIEEASREGKLNLFNKKYELDDRPIEEGCQCPACRSYSRAYIRHLLKAKEMLGMRLCVLHNLYFYNNMMQEIRDALDEGRFAEYKKQKLAGMEENSK